MNLEADEALLTGESVPLRKDPDEVYGNERTGPGDRLNVVFSSSVITKGRGRGVVFATGLFTEIGAIASALGDPGGKKRRLERDADGKVSVKSYLVFAGGKVWDGVGEFLGLKVGTPLQRKLAQLFHYIFMFAVVCAVIVLGANEVSLAVFGGRSGIDANMPSFAREAMPSFMPLQPLSARFRSHSSSS